ncbi:hypothetical protein HG536_0C01150 [Torulaspora globosa]|uniref:Na+/H+ antiporter n=1 Tax=Torulaspora globosa TaxID=48254 RepID=A0A7G3ZEL2_9SACH|nr:uncharacterized protein HG536_0C01150 [Torulaspora globosa]QLL31948.1 hypothetical protein HG536_0C01150 [Torulaspora globosa]
MAVWDQLEPSNIHIAYACIGVFSSIFSLVSLFVKERLYIGESTVAGIFGLIVGPHCLNWFNPLSWGASDSITLEITRIILCLQIFAVAVELPRKYMLKHWLSVTMLLLPVMTSGWLIIGLFVWIVIPGLSFSGSLLIAACITATDPILAQSVVSGKFAQRVPGHLRNLLSAESGCNDGMAFPFIFLSLYLVLYPGNGGLIVKNWICVTILYECIFGCILGVCIGYIGRRAIRFAEEKNIIDRESFLAFYVVLTFMCAGFGSILGVDDLLVSFAAGTAFAWDGWFSTKTQESNVSTVIDLLLNYAYFIYFGAIIPWENFNNPAIGTSVWRLIILAIVVIFLRRIPAVLLLKPFIPDVKSWREALFVGHFGPIGVGAVFAAILARQELEEHISHVETKLTDMPEKGSPQWQLISCIWPIVCFFIVTSIIVHGSSVAIITLGRHLNTITLSKSFTTHTTHGNGKTSWMQRLPSLDKSGRSFSLHRVDTEAPPGDNQGNIETSGMLARPFGGMKRRKAKNKKKHRRRSELFHVLSRNNTRNQDAYDDELNDLGRERLQREKEANAAAFALGMPNRSDKESEEDLKEKLDTSTEHPSSSDQTQDATEGKMSDLHDGIDVMDAQATAHIIKGLDTLASNHDDSNLEFVEDQTGPSPSGESPTDVEAHKDTSSTASSEAERRRRIREEEEEAHVAYAEDNKLIIENKAGEIIDQAEFNRPPRDDEESIGSDLSKVLSNKSSRSLKSLKRSLSPTSFVRMRGLVDTDRNRKYYAYKMDNMLIIEDEEGEVLRRYKINTHDEKTATRPRSASVMAKALSAVGLRSKQSSNAKDKEPSQTEDMKKMVRNLTPAPKNTHARSDEDIGEEDEDDDDELSDDDGYSYDYEQDNDTFSNGSESANDTQSYYDSDEANIADSGAVSDAASETVVERERRLNALGHVSAPRDVDDEEEPPTPIESQPNSGPTAAKKMATIGKTFHLK